jgi:hypothetical protein
MRIDARGLAWAAALGCALLVGACGQRQPVARPATPPAAAPATTKNDLDEPVPVAAPRQPVETEQVAPPGGTRPGKKS